MAEKRANEEGSDGVGEEYSEISEGGVSDACGADVGCDG